MKTRLRLSARLNAVAAQVMAEGTWAGVLADIGTDHAYIPIAACLSGRAHRAVASDCKPGPLQKAKANIHAYGLAHAISTRLGDGLAPLAPGEAGCLVIAGIGGINITGILAAGLATAQTAAQLVLQPQQDIPPLRQWLHLHNFEIFNEKMVYEDRHFYTVMAVRPSHTPVKPWNEVQYLVGKYILEQNDEIVSAYLRQELQKINRWLHALTNPSLTNGGVMPNATDGGVMPNATNGGVTPNATDGGVRAKKKASLARLRACYAEALAQTATNERDGFVCR